MMMEDNTIRVLHVFSGLRRNGAESRTIDIYRNIDKDEIQFDFVVHTKDECDFDKEVKSLGARIYNVPPYRIVNHFRYVKAWDKLLKEHNEYNIIHIHTTNIAAPILFSAKKNGVKSRIVHSRNGLQTGFIKREFLRLTRDYILKYSTHKLAVSKEAGDYVFGSEKYEVLPNAINAKKYIFDQRLRIKYRNELGVSDCTVYGHIGRFIEQKNHGFLIDIFEQIQKKDVHSFLVLVGVGDDYHRIKKLVQDRGLSDKVIFLGKRDDVHQLLNAFDVFVFPSKFEGLPGVVLEAQANGVPCVISDTITKEVAITDLVEYESLSEPSTKWAELAISRKNTARRNMYEEFVNAGFDIETLTQRYQNMYKELSRKCHG